MEISRLRGAAFYHRSEFDGERMNVHKQKNLFLSLTQILPDSIISRSNSACYKSPTVAYFCAPMTTHSQFTVDSTTYHSPQYTAAIVSNTIIPQVASFRKVE